MSIKHIAAVSLTLALGGAGCGGDDSSSSDPATVTDKQTSGSTATKAEGPVKIASAPGADHGWMAAITENARDRPRSSATSSSRSPRA